MSKLTILFAGICTHFRFGVVAGVPHRVVLPSAAMVMTGQLSIRNTVDPNPGPPLQYYLLPHYPQITVEGLHHEHLNVPALVNDGGAVIQNGDILSGVRMQVINAVETSVSYETDQTPKLTDYDPQYTLSGDVVHQGRASCYFDFNGGTVRSIRATGGAFQTTIEVTTNGAPQIVVTPLASSNLPTLSHVLTLPDHPTVAMTVSNLEPESEVPVDSEGGAFDFLFNYLTAHGGIPQVIRKSAPGMPVETLRSATPDAYARALHKLAELARHPGEKRKLRFHDEATPSCSDSQYP
jgi:hypothetical protein